MQIPVLPYQQYEMDVLEWRQREAAARIGGIMRDLEDAVRDACRLRVPVDMVPEFRSAIGCVWTGYTKFNFSTSHVTASVTIEDQP